MATLEPVAGYDGKWVRHNHFCPNLLKATVLPCLAMKDVADRITWATGVKLAIAYGALLPLGFVCVVVFVYNFVLWFCLQEELGKCTEKNWLTEGGDLIAPGFIVLLVLGLSLIYLPRFFWWYKMPKVLHITEGACCNIIRLWLHLWLWGCPLAQDIETSKKMVGQPFQGTEATPAKEAGGEATKKV